jgi:hypothetical protein
MWTEQSLVAAWTSLIPAGLTETNSAFYPARRQRQWSNPGEKAGFFITAFGGIEPARQALLDVLTGRRGTHRLEWDEEVFDLLVRASFPACFVDTLADLMEYLPPPSVQSSQVADPLALAAICVENQGTVAAAIRLLEEALGCQLGLGANRQTDIDALEVLRQIQAPMSLSA